MAAAVVDLLEVVDVDHQHGQRVAVAQAHRQLDGGAGHPGAPVEDPGQAVEAFVRPEAVSLARHAGELPAEHPHHAGLVESLLFDGANSAVLLREQASRTEFRIALPQTGRFADLRIGETVAFSFDPQHAVCFASANA